MNLRPIPAGDTTPAALLPFTLLADHTITFDRFASWYAESQKMPPVWFRRLRDGHYYSIYPIALPVLLTPLYTPVAFLDIRNMPVDRVVVLARILEKGSASLIAALSAVAFLALAGRLTDKRTALLLTIVYAFGSQTWSTSSQALWQHGASELAIILGLLGLLWASSRPDRLLPVALAGVCAGFSVAFRITNVIFLIILGGYVLLSRWNAARKAAFAVSAMVAPAATLAYNLLLFGSPLGGYDVGLVMFQRGDVWSGLSGLLFSPSRGLLVFSPVFIFVLAGVYQWMRGPGMPHPEIYWICVFAATGHLLLISKSRGWYGGFNYGPRLLTDVVPCLVILLVPAMSLVVRLRPWKFAFGCALLVSISVQAIGAFCYPNGHWDALPQPVNKSRQRLWDWRDNQIARSAAAGPVLEPYRLAIRFLEHPGLPAEGSLKDQGVKLW